MKHITLEDALDARGVLVVAIDVYKRLLGNYTPRGGIQYEARHWGHEPLVTDDLAEAVEHYNKTFEVPEGWTETGRDHVDQRMKMIAAIEAMGYHWDGETWTLTPPGQ